MRRFCFVLPKHNHFWTCYEFLKNLDVQIKFSNNLQQIISPHFSPHFSTFPHTKCETDLDYYHQKVNT